MGLDRKTFEALRDLPGKRIAEDIRFVASRAMRPLLIAEDIHIQNEHGIDLRLTIKYNPEVGSSTFNVHVPGTGPICRLDVDGPPHRPLGRSHKHALQNEDCPRRNLSEGIIERPDLSGQDVPSLFSAFCATASIQHEGAFFAPDADAGGADGG
ncbi:MAG TPA: hypothetical protein VFE33_15065 [Thermoanaerobaculia bacterium]|nr:hypothetical protein [Thermoanaerobaculia bacterium]